MTTGHEAFPGHHEDLAFILRVIKIACFCFIDEIISSETSLRILIKI